MGKRNTNNRKKCNGLLLCVFGLIFVNLVCGSKEHLTPGEQDALDGLYIHVNMYGEIEACKSNFEHGLFYISSQKYTLTKKNEDDIPQGGVYKLIETSVNHEYAHYLVINDNGTITRYDFNDELINIFIKINYNGGNAKETEKELQNIIDNNLKKIVKQVLQNAGDDVIWFEPLLHCFKESDCLKRSLFSVGSTVPNPGQTEKPKLLVDTGRNNVVKDDPRNEIVLYLLLSVGSILIVVKIFGCSSGRADIKNPSPAEEHDIETPPPLTHNLHNIENTTGNVPTEHSDPTLDNSDSVLKTSDSGSIFETADSMLTNSDSVLKDSDDGVGNSDPVLENSDSIEASLKSSMLLATY